MGRSDRFNGHDPERIRLEQAMNAARAVPLGSQKPVEPKLNWTPTGMGQMATLPVPLPDQNGNPIVFCFGGALLVETFAAQLLAGSLVLSPALLAEEREAMVRGALETASLLIAMSRQPQVPNPPAPETVVE